MDVDALGHVRAAARWLMIALFVVVSGSAACARRSEPDHAKVPGVVVDHSPASTGRYIGSPSIAILADGNYVASHDYFGPKAGHREAATTVVFTSSDRGQTWRKIATIKPLFWGKLFVHRGDLYALGVTHEYGDLVLRRSRDGGQTWTEPADETSGRLTTGGHYHCAPCPVLVHRGRIWKSLEQKAHPRTPWGDFRTLVVSAPVDADLLDASNWRFSETRDAKNDWLDGQFMAWLEGNVVAAPEGHLVNILRINTQPTNTEARDQAAMVGISADGKHTSFDADEDIIDMPGGAKKFAIRHDPTSGRYWSLVNYVRPQDVGKANAGSIRNTLALASSADLRNWTVHSIILSDPDVKHVGFQYVDWTFDGSDLIAVSRTAYDDDLGGAVRAHDANYLTYHRIKDFRAARRLSLLAQPAEAQYTADRPAKTR